MTNKLMLFNKKHKRYNRSIWKKMIGIRRVASTKIKTLTNPSNYLG